MTSLMVDSEDLDKIAEEITSLEHYVGRALPHAIKSLTGILKRLGAGEINPGDARVRAVICKSVGDSAMSRYPHDMEVMSYDRRLKALYDEVEKYFRGPPN